MKMETQLQAIKKTQGDVILKNYIDTDESRTILEALPEGAVEVESRVLAGTAHKHYVTNAQVYKNDDVLYVVPGKGAALIHENSELNRHDPVMIDDQSVWVVNRRLTQDPMGNVRAVED